MKRLKKIFWIFIAAFVLLSGHTETEVQAMPGDVYTLNLEGLWNYKESYELLQLFNKLRTSAGLSPFVYDQDLTRSAMVRAAECVISYSSARPDGSSFRSVNPRVETEFIINGYATAQETYNQWISSSSLKSNLLNSSNLSVGIGCVTQGSQTYWVQLFSETGSTGGDVPASQTVKISIENIKGTENELYFNMNEIAAGRALTLEKGKDYFLEAGRINNTRKGIYGSFTGDSFLWSSTDPSVVTVDQMGNIKTVSLGDATITATPKIGNGKAKPATLLVQVRGYLSKAEVEDIPSAVYSGSPYIPDLKVTLDGKTLKKNVDYTVEFDDNVNAGRHTLKIRGTGNYVGTLTPSFRIDQLNISDDVKLELLSDDFSAFENKEDALAAFLTVTYKGKKLEEGTHYYLSVTSYSSNSFWVYFKGNYKGNRWMFNVKDGYMQPVAKQKYTGKAIVPDIKIYTDENRYVQLREGTDYSLKIIDNIKPGIAYVLVTGKGEYFGSFEGYFEIEEPVGKGKLLSVKSGSKGAVTVRWEKDARAGGYQVQAALNSKFTSGKKTKNVSGNSVKSYTFKNMSRGNNCYVRVRSWKKISGKVYYGSWSTVQKVTVK